MATGATNTVVIKAGATTSASFALGNLALVGVSCPTLGTGASLSLKVSSDGGATFQTMVTDSTGSGTNGSYTILPASSTGAVYVGINEAYILGVDYVQFVLSASQAGDITLILHLRDKR